MTTTITFLGTGADALVVGGQQRASGGLIIRIEDLQFHIDPGPGSLNALRSNAINPRETTAVIVTNNRIYHCNDVNAMLSAMTQDGLDKRGILAAAKSVLTGERPYLTEQHETFAEKIIPLERNKKFGIENVDILATSARHTDETAIGIKFYTPEFVLGYTSATAYHEELEEDFKDCNILIIHCKNPFGAKQKYAMSADGVVKLLNAVKPGLAIITGFGIKMLDADPIYHAREIQKKTGINTMAAKDNMIINPLAYVDSHSQRTLSGFG